jgi:multiple sugar transport system ATP-binding protein
MAQLQLKSVSKRFGAVPVIAGLSLDLPHGEFIACVGPSGCGKSTLLRLVAGLEEPDEGDILIGGTSVRGRPAAERGVAMVFQNYALYPHMTVRDNLAFGLQNVRMAPAEIERRVAESARLLQLDALLARLPRELSGGQRQRVAIGRAITREPGLFLFDEPLSNLDAELRVHMRVELARLHQRLDSTMLYVTHDQVEAMTLADRIVVLREGRVEQVGAPLDLYNRPANLFVAGFIGAPRMNLLAGQVQAVDGDTLTFGAPGLPPLKLQNPGLPLQPGQPATLGVRPPDWEGAANGDSALPASVQVVEEHGADCILHCRLENGATLAVHRAGQRGAARGEALRLRPRPGAWHLFDGAGARIA